MTDPAHTDEYFLGLAIEQAQIGWEEGEGFESCDWLDPAAFANGLLRLHETPDLWRRVQSSGLTRIRQECAPEAYRERLRQICEASTFA